MRKQLKGALVIIGFAMLMVFSGFMTILSPANAQAAEPETAKTGNFLNYYNSISIVVLNAISDEQNTNSIKVPAIQKSVPMVVIILSPLLQRVAKLLVGRGARLCAQKWLNMSATCYSSNKIGGTPIFGRLLTVERGKRQQRSLTTPSPLAGERVTGWGEGECL
jgi:hypothetical protein